MFSEMGSLEINMPRPKSEPAYCTNCDKQLAQSPSKRGKSGLCHKCVISRPSTKEHKKNLSDALKGRKFSEEHCRNLSKAKRELYKDPTLHPRWKGGKDSYWGNVARKIVNVTDPNLHVHHIDGDNTNNSPENLVVLTKADHTRLHDLQGRAKHAANKRWECIHRYSHSSSKRCKHGR